MHDANGELIHGTINIVLANRNGIVVVTDSMQTRRDSRGRESQVTIPAQKLFRLDDCTVCTVAGFGSATISSAEEFNTEVAAIIKQYADELKTRPSTVGMSEKLRSLGFLLEFHISAVASIRDALNSPAGNYRFQITVAGFDADGQAKVGSVGGDFAIYEGLEGRRSILFSQNKCFLRRLERELTYEVAGQSAEAVKILRNPAVYSCEPALKGLAASIVENKGEALSVQALQAIGEALIGRTSSVYSSVGGQIQSAVLTAGRITNFEVPVVSTPDLPRRFSFFSGNKIVGKHPISAPTSTLLFVGNSWTGTRGISIDGHFFFGNTLRNCTVRYDGGFARFDASNRVSDSALLLGPQVDQNTDFVRHLKNDFKWTWIARLMPPKS